MKILAFGEILFDVDVKNNVRKLGGAPMNFCSHLSKLGAEGFILSSVGRDSAGGEALDFADNFNVNKKYILPNELSTGVCNVTYNGSEPDYNLSIKGAYDNICVTDEMLEEMKEENFDVFYFGTLAQRSDVSKNSLLKVLENVNFRKVFCDLNLRQTYYSDEVLSFSLEKSDILKINRDEFAFLKEKGYCESIKNLCEKYNIEKILLTLDKDGAQLYDFSEDKTYFSMGVETEEVSSVGAGDSMCACFLYNYLNDKPLQLCLDRANIMGAFVVSREEAIPEYTDELIEKVK
ncbi:MAG: hypothetical protein E7536_04595 [Ruminococcaceae bacterium]|nr:hypothetical protein [Oscillospiraceae bacterium]